MKIIIISNMYPNERSYIGIFVKRQIESLESEGIRIIKIVKKNKSLIAYIHFMLEILYRLLFNSYDLVHCHYGFHSGLIPAIIKRKPLIVTFHGSDALIEPFRNKIYYFLQKYIILRSDYLIGVSSDVKNKIVESLDADPNKISVINCGIDTSVFRPLKKNEMRKKIGISQNQKIVLFAGTISYMKGVDIIYQCASEMKNVLFILVGHARLVKNLPNCKIIGPRQHNEMPVWMNAADIFILPSRSEGTPVVLLEALSCGIPTIASDIGGCPDIIMDGYNGFIVPAGNWTILKEKIDFLINKKDLREEMGIRGRSMMIDDHDSRKVANRIIEIYFNVLKKVTIRNDK